MKKLLQLGILMCMFLPFMGVRAANSVTVSSQAELKNALNDSSISTILLGGNIETTEKINILRPVTIDGENHTIKYVGTFGSSGSTDSTVWGGIYVLQVYKTDVTLKDIKLTGGNGGLLVNGGKVTVKGTLDVSGNGFGGIELGQGVSVQSNAHLVLASNGKIVNSTEAEDRPTLWVPEDSTKAILEINGKQITLEANKYVTLSDIQGLMNPVENPSTNDAISIYSMLIFAGISLILLETYKKRNS